MMHRRSKRRVYKWLAWTLGPILSTVLILALINIDDVVMAQGIAEPTRKIYIDAPLARVVDRVVAVPGDTVQAGEIVAQLYNADLKSAVASAEKELAGARANLEVAESRLDFLREQPTPEELRIAESGLEQSRINLEARRQDLERARHLYLGERLWSQEELERAQTSYDLAQATLKVSVENLSLVRRGASPAELARASAEVRQARANLDKAKQALQATRDVLALTTLRTPSDGVVARQDLFPGMLANQGGIVMIIAGLDRKTVIAAWMGETNAWKVQLGQQVEILSNLFTDREDFAGLGEVSEIHGYAVHEGGARTFGVKVDVVDTPIPLRYGSTADLRIVVGRRSILKILLGVENRSDVEALRNKRMPVRIRKPADPPDMDASENPVVRTGADSSAVPAIQ